MSNAQQDARGAILPSPNRAHPHRRALVSAALVVVAAAAALRPWLGSRSVDAEARLVETREKRISAAEMRGGQRKITGIHFIGERHSGTNWMFRHLVDCFGHEIKLKSRVSRWKHWFQYYDPSRVMNNSLVIAQFRDPYDWVEAMYERQYHAPVHGNASSWREFVTLPWTMTRPDVDEERRIEGPGKRVCACRFRYEEVIPCDEGEHISRKALYELRRDGSGLPYDSIVDLRGDKIRNFLEVGGYGGVAAMLTVRYEELAEEGTGWFLSKVEALTGAKARCKPFGAGNHTRGKVLDPEFVAWMNQHVDWSAEDLIGYARR